MKRDKQTSFKKYREKLKEKAKNLKDYLKGRVIPGTESLYAPKKKKIKIGTKWLPLGQHKNRIRQYKKKRKAKNKAAYRSRRINQLRAK